MPDVVVLVTGRDLNSTFTIATFINHNHPYERWKTHQSPVTFPVRLLTPLVVHPTASIDKVAEHIQERLLYDLL